MTVKILHTLPYDVVKVFERSLSRSRPKNLLLYLSRTRTKHKNSDRAVVLTVIGYSQGLVSGSSIHCPLNAAI